MFNLYTLHLPPQDSDDLTTFFRVAGLDNPTTVSRQLAARRDAYPFYGYCTSATGELLVTAYGCDITNWHNNDYGTAFAFRTALFEVATPGVFRFPTCAGEEPTLQWDTDVRTHEAPKVFTTAGIAHALGMRQ